MRETHERMGVPYVAALQDQKQQAHLSLKTQLHPTARSDPLPGAMPRA